MALEDGLIASYHMNNDWFDSAGSNDGTPAGATFDTVNKKLGSAAGNFDGIDDYADVGSALSSVIANDMSISLWFRGVTDSTNRMVFGSRGGVGDLGVEVGVLNTALGSKAFIQVFGASDSGSRLGISNVRDNSFHHIVVVRDGINFYIYVDDSREDGVLNTMTGSASTTSNTFIGKSEASAGMGKGQLDEINIWDRAISASEVSELWNGGAGIEIPVVAGIVILRRRMEGY